MADWFIATEGVKVVKDSASLGPQIITAVSTIASAVGAVFTYRKLKNQTIPLSTPYAT